MTTLPVNFRRVAVMIGIVVLVSIVLEFNRRLEELTLLNKQHDLVQAQATQAMQTQIALQTEVAYAGSVNAVDEWARTSGHYVRDGDLPVVPIPQPGTTTFDFNEPTPVPTQMTNAQTWWDLFFGEH